MSQKKGGRFDDLIDAAKMRQQRDIAVSKSKSTDSEYIRTTLYLPKNLHKQLKAKALFQEKQMSDIVTELIAEWLNSDSRSGE
jgi:hypothetical protein